eukprot:gene17564-19316_t
MRLKLSICSCFILTQILSSAIATSVLQLDNSNYEDSLKKYKVLLVNFYADWCTFSQMLAPIFEQAAGIIKEEFPDTAALARVDCEAELTISSQNGISKYPTLKIFRNGKPMRKEYRGQRSVDAFSNFIRKEMKASVKEFHSPEDFKPDNKSNNVFGYFENRADQEYLIFEKIADELKDDCEFWVGFGEASQKERVLGDSIVFRPQLTNGESDSIYTGDLKNLEVVRAWTHDLCIPLVREINFENGEQLTEEGLPFLLLFYNPSDVESIKTFKHVVSSDLAGEREKINFLTADGTTFSHPLHHLDKSINDLPLIAIDSFRHMYLFPKFEDIKVPGRLKQFIDDLHSGKLHREYHNGPDPTEAPPQVEHQAGEVGEQAQGEQQQQQTHEQEQQQSHEEDMSGSGAKTGPPETVFSKLMPSENRYTLLRYRDEL